MVFACYQAILKTILPFSSISLVNWMLVFCLLKCCVQQWSHRQRKVAKEGVSQYKFLGLVPGCLHDYFSHNNGSRGAHSCSVFLFVVFAVVLSRESVLLKDDLTWQDTSLWSPGICAV